MVEKSFLEDSNCEIFVQESCGHQDSTCDFHGSNGDISWPYLTSAHWGCVWTGLGVQDSIDGQKRPTGRNHGTPSTKIDESSGSENGVPQNQMVYPPVN
jgi:hypothetical protein